MPAHPFDLTGKTALVTGGNRGIGLAMSRALASAGARVVVWGVNPDRLAAAETELSAIGPGARAIRADVSDETAVREAFAESVEWAGGNIHTVVANAAADRILGRLKDFETPRYRDAMAVNLDGVFFTVREACKHMSDRAKAGQPGGVILGVSSLAGIQGAAGNGVYAAAKGAVIAMINTVATEYARAGVRANTIVPGWIATERMAVLNSEPAFAEKVLPRVPAGRWGEAGDFAGVVVYLASDAAAYHTGDTLVIDGGYSVF